jgi:hypothetical protein
MEVSKVYPTRDKLDQHVVNVFRRITAEMIPGFSVELHGTRESYYGLVYCTTTSKHGAYFYLGLVIDLNSYSDEQIINHAYAVLGMERPPERTVKHMITEETKKQAYDAGAECAAIWTPLLNPDASHENLFALGMWMAEQAGYTDMKASMAYVKGFTEHKSKKNKLIAGKVVPVGAAYDALPYEDDK